MTPAVGFKLARRSDSTGDPMILLLQTRKTGNSSAGAESTGSNSKIVRTSRTKQGAATAAARALASFGLNILHLIRLELIVAETNFIGQAVAERIGASREIRLPNRLILGGEIWHAYLFSLLSLEGEK
jgi:hypothetical protein